MAPMHLLVPRPAVAKGLRSRAPSGRTRAAPRNVPRGARTRGGTWHDSHMAIAFPQKLLGAGEEVILHERTHWKALILPALILIATSAVGGFLLAVGGDWAMWPVIVVGVLVILLFSVWPFLNWLASTDTLTNRRLITRQGVITRTGRDIQLKKVNDVAYERGIIDRMLGCGTLVVESAGERGHNVIRDVPKVELFHLKLQELLLDVDIPDETDSSRRPDQTP